MKKILLLALSLVFITSCFDRVMNEATVTESGDTLIIPENPRGFIITKISMIRDFNVYYTDTLSKKILIVTYYKDNWEWRDGLEWYFIKLPNGLVLEK